MKDQLITFETAELALLKGFNYMKANIYGDNMAYQLPEGTLITAHKANSVSGYILAPTQSLLQKWLRDIHSIYVLPMPLNDETKFYFDVVVLEIQEYPIEIDFEQYSNNMHCIEVKTYEEALEYGLVKALKLI